MLGSRVCYSRDGIFRRGKISDGTAEPQYESEIVN